MKKEHIASKKGYPIPIIHNLESVNGDNSSVVLISHGFGSSKESPTVKLMTRILREEGIPSLSFDFPAHGESSVDGNAFTLDNCLSDLSQVEEFARTKRPHGEIFYFSSSFGGYINLLHISQNSHFGTKSFLRCPAVNMPDIIKKSRTPDMKRQMDEKGFVTLGEKDGFFRPLKLSQTFYDQLQSHNLFDLYQPGNCRVSMVHGTEDESVDPLRVKAFAERFQIPLLWIPGADHTFSGPGMMDQVARTAMRFFLK